jgi:hypothetical protein
MLVRSAPCADRNQLLQGETSIGIATQLTPPLFHMEQVVADAADRPEPAKKSIPVYNFFGGKRLRLPSHKSLVPFVNLVGAQGLEPWTR